MKQIMLLILTLGSIVSLQAQNLDKMEEQKRREMLLKIAKATVMEYGPDFYREYGQPEIFHGFVGVGPEGSKFPKYYKAKYMYRSYYRVTYFYDKKAEAFPEAYAVEVSIWGDTGEAISIFFGASSVGYVGLDIRDKSKPLKKVTWQKRPPGHFDPPKPKRVDVEYVPKKKEKDTSERKNR